MGLHKIYTDSFERVWAVYPLKQGKRTAFKAFEKECFPDSEIDELVEIIEKRKRLDVKWNPDQNGKVFIPMLSTFINNARWEDNYKPITRERASERFFVPEPERTDSEWEASNQARLKALH